MRRVGGTRPTAVHGVPRAKDPPSTVVLWGNWVVSHSDASILQIRYSYICCHELIEKVVCLAGGMAMSLLPGNTITDREKIRYARCGTVNTNPFSAFSFMNTVY